MGMNCSAATDGSICESPTMLSMEPSSWPTRIRRTVSASVP